MLIKVCGMRDADNIERVAALAPDLMGFIFFARSPRSAVGLDQSVVRSLPVSIGRVGVFVNQDAPQIERTAELYELTHLQLHGDESPEFCRRIRSKTRCCVIKATTPIRGVEYDEAVDYLLFDTPSPLHGGSGLRFDWRDTDRYEGCRQWLLSGGIGEEHERELIAKNPFGVDLNSRFELTPGIKNTELLETFIKKIRRQ